MKGHWLEVTRWYDDRDCTTGVEWEVHHPDDCPTETCAGVDPALDDSPAAAAFLATPCTWRTCLVAWELDGGGLDSLDVYGYVDADTLRDLEAGRLYDDVRYDREGLGSLDGWKLLRPGWYEIKAWSVRTPSTPNGPEEWDAGLAIVRGPYPTAPGSVRFRVADVGVRSRTAARRVLGALRGFLGDVRVSGRTDYRSRPHVYYTLGSYRPARRPPSGVTCDHVHGD